VNFHHKRMIRKGSGAVTGKGSCDGYLRIPGVHYRCLTVLEMVILDIYQLIYCNT
jgi:hypothetical protein